jgi:hypothetical protein
MLKILLLFAFAAAAQDFTTVTEDIAKRCDFEAGTCSSEYTARVLVRENNKTIFKRFDRAAKRMSTTWADTILEGDYYAYGDTKASRALEISRAGKIVAYQLEIYEEAIETGEEGCRRDENTSEDAWLYFGTCLHGRIYEVNYLSPDFQEDAVDYERYATFFESPQEKAKIGYKKNQ